MGVFDLHSICLSGCQANAYYMIMERPDGPDISRYDHYSMG